MLREGRGTNERREEIREGRVDVRETSSRRRGSRRSPRKDYLLFFNVNAPGCHPRIKRGDNSATVPPRAAARAGVRRANTAMGTRESRPRRAGTTRMGVVRARTRRATRRERDSRPARRPLSAVVGAVSRRSASVDPSRDRGRARPLRNARQSAMKPADPRRGALRARFAAKAAHRARARGDAARAVARARTIEITPRFPSRRDGKKIAC